MSIARVTMVEFNDEDSYSAVETLYSAHRDDWFPNLEQVIDIKTGPTSGISIALYPSFEEAASNLEGREKMIKMIDPYIKDTFYHEGEVIRNDLLDR